MGGFYKDLGGGGGRGLSHDKSRKAQRFTKQIIKRFIKIHCSKKFS